MTKNITVCSLFSALICVGAFIRIPLPALSITLQVLFVLLAGMLLGAKKAIISTVIYIAVGLAGLPVFSAGGGFSYIFNPRFGYLTGFIVSSAAVGIICRKKPCLKGYFIAGLIGVSVIYLFGITYYHLICKYVIGQPVSAEFLFTYCFITVIPGDLLSVIGAALLTARLRKIEICKFY